MLAAILIRSTGHPVDPYPAYAALRAAGPAVRLDKYGIWAVPRFAEIKTIFADHVNFSNAGGAGIANNFKTKPWRPPSIILEADPPLHTRTRKVSRAHHVAGGDARA